MIRNSMAGSLAGLLGNEQFKLHLIQTSSFGGCARPYRGPSYLCVQRYLRGNRAISVVGRFRARRVGDPLRAATGASPTGRRQLPGPIDEGPSLPGRRCSSPLTRGRRGRRMVRGQKLRGRGRILLPAGPSLAPTNRDADPRPLLLGSLSLRGWIGSRRALRTPRRRIAMGARPLEEALAFVVAPRGRCIDRAARRGGHPPGWESWLRDGDLGAPLRTAARGSGRPRLRSLPRPRLRSGRCLK